MFINVTSFLHGPLVLAAIMSIYSQQYLRHFLTFYFCYSTNQLSCHQEIALHVLPISMYNHILNGPGLSRLKPAPFIQPKDFLFVFFFLYIHPTMPSIKPRLHVGLYARGNTDPCGEDTYHWALLVTPKSEKESTNPAVKRYHVTNTEPAPGHNIPPWQYKIVPLRSV